MVRHATNDSVDHTSETVEEIEQRVRRLENAVAAMQDTHLMEDRVVERVVHRLDQIALPSLHDSAGLIVDANRVYPPKMLEAGPANGSPAGEGTSGVDAVAAAARTPWLVLEVLREFRAMLRMLTDYRYRMTWTARIVLVAAMCIVVLSWLLLSGSFFGVGTIIDRVILVVVVVVSYKVLSREVLRYQDLLAHMYRYR